jgi:formylglycine-generating enzyme
MVPGGAFQQGRGKEDCGTDICEIVDGGSTGCPSGMTCDAAETPEFSSTVSSFTLDKYEVTGGRFSRFVNAYVDNVSTVPTEGSGANPAIPGSGWRTAWNAFLPATRDIFKDYQHLGFCGTWTDNDWDRKPVTCVSWYEAFAFCIWDGGRLPTEAEWEYAAAGGAENRLYPWGPTAPDCTYANFYNGWQFCAGSWSPTTRDVGSTPLGNGKWSSSDLAGNANEWTLDWYGTYPAFAATNYANISGGTERIFRGGSYSFYQGQVRLRAAWRGLGTPDFRYDVGVRCARAAQ